MTSASFFVADVAVCEYELLYINYCVMSEPLRSKKSQAKETSEEETAFSLSLSHTKKAERDEYSKKSKSKGD